MRPADLARRLVVGNSTVTMWLRNERNPSTEFCSRIADALDLTYDEVLVAAGHRPPDYDADPDSPPERFHAMMKRIHWDPQREAMIDAILRQMVEFDRESGG